MYSTKNIDNILLSAALSENTRNKYTFFNEYGIDELMTQFFKKDYSEAWKAYQQGHKIFRGHRRLERNNIIGVIPGIRVSENTSNIYTQLFSHLLPSWEGYPTRDKCVVCTNNADKALKYSNNDIFYVFPQNRTKIGICPAGDIWYSFNLLLKQYRIDTLNEFNILFSDYIGYIYNQSEDDVSDKFDTDDIENIELIFHGIEYSTREHIDNKIAEIEDDEDLKKWTRIDDLETLAIREFIDEAINKNGFFEWQNNPFIEDLITNAYHDNLLMWLDEILSPKANGFKLGTVFDIPNGNNEIWFSEPYLMISGKYFNELFN